MKKATTSDDKDNTEEGQSQESSHEAKDSTEEDCDVGIKQGNKKRGRESQEERGPNKKVQKKRKGTHANH